MHQAWCITQCLVLLVTHFLHTAPTAMVLDRGGCRGAKVFQQCPQGLSKKWRCRPWRRFLDLSRGRLQRMCGEPACRGELRPWDLVKRKKNSRWVPLFSLCCCRRPITACSGMRWRMAAGSAQFEMLVGCDGMLCHSCWDGRKHALSKNVCILVLLLGAVIWLHRRMWIDSGELDWGFKNDSSGREGTRCSGAAQVDVLLLEK